jgi:hypothetical protein
MVEVSDIEAIFQRIKNAADKLMEFPARFGAYHYSTYAESVQLEMRFVRSHGAKNFLDAILKSCAGRVSTIEKGTVFWRARLGSDYEGEAPAKKAIPYPSSGMKPIVNWQSEGRANPRGIAYLYMATTRETALAEVRPWIGAYISVSQLHTQRDLKVVDCSKLHAENDFRELIYDKTKKVEDGMWAAIDRAFATPVSKDDETKGYIPTQIIAELFKSADYDGVLYKSLLSEGYNLVLFKCSDAEVLDVNLVTTTSIDFRFKDGI